MAAAPVPGSTRGGGWQNIAPNFRYRITPTEGEPYEVRTIPIDHHTATRLTDYRGLDGNDLSSAYPLAWAASRRIGSASPDYLEWLATIDTMEFFDLSKADDDPKAEPLDESQDSSPEPE